MKEGEATITVIPIDLEDLPKNPFDVLTNPPTFPDIAPVPVEPAARPATDEEVQASAKRMLEKHRPSLEKLAEHDGPWRRILREELAHLRPDVARFKLRRFVAYTRALLDKLDRAEPNVALSASRTEPQEATFTMSCSVCGEPVILDREDADVVHKGRCSRPSSPPTLEPAAPRDQEAETRGTFACPLCGVEGIHAHGDGDVFDWLDAQTSRFGYRLVQRRWAIRRDDEETLTSRVDHCLRRLRDEDYHAFRVTPMGRRILETFQLIRPIVQQSESFQPLAACGAASQEPAECSCGHAEILHTGYADGHCAVNGCPCKKFTSPSEAAASDRPQNDVIASITETLRNIIADGPNQPMGRLLWMLQLSVERLDLLRKS